MARLTRSSWLACGLVLLCLGGLTQCMPAASLGADVPLSALERELVREINLARTQPHKYVAFLTQLRPHYVGRELRRPGDLVPAGGRNAILVTSEGGKAVDEAIAFLRATTPLPPLAVSRGLSLAAQDHVKDQGRTGSTGHQGSDGSRSGDRVDRYGRWQGQIGENIAYSVASARGMILSLIIDDGVPGRGHRHNLFAARARVAGVACGSHRTLQSMCVMLLAAGYTERATK